MYEYKGDYNNADDIITFIISDFTKIVKGNPIKPAKSIVQKISYVLLQNFEAFIEILDNMGFRPLPKILKVLMIFLVLLMPITGVILCIYLVKEPVLDQENVEKKEEKQKVVEIKKKTE